MKSNLITQLNAVYEINADENMAHNEACRLKSLRPGDAYMRR